MYINYRIQRTPTDSKNSHCRLPMANKLLNVYIIGDTIRVCTKTKQWTTSYICWQCSEVTKTLNEEIFSKIIELMTMDEAMTWQTAIKHQQTFSDRYYYSCCNRPHTELTNLWLLVPMLINEMDFTNSKLNILTTCITSLTSPFNHRQSTLSRHWRPWAGRHSLKKMFLHNYSKIFYQYAHLKLFLIFFLFHNLWSEIRDNKVPTSFLACKILMSLLTTRV